MHERSKSFVVVQLCIFALLLALLIPSVSSAATCPNLSRNLAFGTRGADVIELQTFLIAVGALSAGNSTGYFGRLTEAAVKSWQAKLGIVSNGSPATTGYGRIGPKTRAAIARECGGNLKPIPMTLPKFYFSPGSGGPAPFTATFGAEGLATTWTDPQTGFTREISDLGARYIDFGDGSVRYDIVCPNTPATTCMVNVPHSYQKSGTYTATLFESGMAGIATIAQATIVVTSATQENPNASLRLERYSNYSAQAYFSGCKAPFSLDSGDGSAPRVYEDIPYMNGSGSFVPSSEYLLYMEKDGIYTVTLTCGATKIQKTFIASGGEIAATKKEPQIRYFLNGNPLKVQFSLTVPSACSPYNLSWGDRGTPFTFGGIPSGEANANCSNMITKKFEHTYPGAKNYTIGFSSGASSQMVTANITGSDPSGPVCGAPPFRCSGMCAQVKPQPRTYSSLAALRADEAAVIYAGSCEDTTTSN